MKTVASDSCKLSIVIPVYNRANVVGRTLNSLQKQQLDDVEIILVDNNSTDDTLDRLNTWADTMCSAGRSVRVTSEPRRGAAAARNRGLEMARGGWIMFFDSDDEMADGHVAGVVATIEADDVDVVGWEISQELASGRRKTGRFVMRNRLWGHLMHGSLSTQRFAVRTRLVRDAGGWDETLSGWDDYELGVRILLSGPRIKKLPGERVITHFSDESITGATFADNPLKWEHPLNVVENELHRAGFKTLWVEVRRVILAANYRHEGAKAESKRLMAEVLRRQTSCRSRAALRLIAWKHRLFPVGTTMFATLFFSKS